MRSLLWLFLSSLFLLDYCEWVDQKLIALVRIFDFELWEFFDGSCFWIDHCAILLDDIPFIVEDDCLLQDPVTHIYISSGEIFLNAFNLLDLAESGILLSWHELEVVAELLKNTGRDHLNFLRILPDRTGYRSRKATHWYHIFSVLVIQDAIQVCFIFRDCRVIIDSSALRIFLSYNWGASAFTWGDIFFIIFLFTEDMRCSKHPQSLKTFALDILNLAASIRYLFLHWGY